MSAFFGVQGLTRNVDIVETGFKSGMFGMRANGNVPLGGNYTVNIRVRNNTNAPKSVQAVAIAQHTDFRNVTRRSGFVGIPARGTTVISIPGFVAGSNPGKEPVKVTINQKRGSGTVVSSVDTIDVPVGTFPTRPTSKRLGGEFVIR